ncbi:MAG: ankyrin repeat domain-containing protein [Saprospiraceae bacterium]|nr:ankyrin repeat domain-containing protein [Saprospiraceae bacterium]
MNRTIFLALFFIATNGANLAAQKLHAALWQDDMVKAKTLANSPKQLNYASSGNGITPLMVVLAKAYLSSTDSKQKWPPEIYLSLAQFLLDKGAKLDLRDKSGKTALHYAVLFNFSGIAINMLEKGGDATVQDTAGNTLIHYASINGDTLLLRRLLKNETNINIANHQGLTPLHISIKNKQTFEAKWLIGQGADIHAKTKADVTPLLMTAQYGLLEMFDYLLSLGADLSATSKLGLNALHYAAANGHLEIAKPLLARGFALDALTHDHETPLLLALTLKQDTMAIFLLEAGADPRIASKNGLTPLHEAAKNGYSEAAIAMMAKGADINAKTPEMQITPLHFAIVGKHTAMANLLVAKGADVNFVSGIGTPFWVANLFDQEEILDSLLAHGASSFEPIDSTGEYCSLSAECYEKLAVWHEKQGNVQPVVENYKLAADWYEKAYTFFHNEKKRMNRKIFGRALLNAAFATTASVAAQYSATQQAKQYGYGYEKVEYPALSTEDIYAKKFKNMDLEQECSKAALFCRTAADCYQNNYDKEAAKRCVELARKDK